MSDQSIQGLRDELEACEDARDLYSFGVEAIDQLEKTLSELKTQRARADLAEAKVVELTSELAIEVSEIVIESSVRDGAEDDVRRSKIRARTAEARADRFESLAIWLRGFLENELISEFEGCERFESIMNEISERCDDAKDPTP